ncbi:MAG: hypothetical protein Hyperionvirus1_50 [Hyperionvirus sp.]|uniref:Uncharacterized protein n=1 Tax=Hyperionvirus sp. TaxID=2487770 RepID=A0A3G5A8H9_9VIRU|nr:MAG: hypothetical protein Hyperionvirus1_50 [Hyperionvirus sp.]
MSFDYLFERYPPQLILVFIGATLTLLASNHAACVSMRMICPEKENVYIVRVYVSSFLLKMLYSIVRVLIGIACTLGAVEINYMYKVKLRGSFCVDIILMAFVLGMFVVTTNYPFTCIPKFAEPELFEFLVLLPNVGLFAVGSKQVIGYNIETFEIVSRLCRDKSIMDYN